MPMQTAGTCYGIPDLNEVPAVEDSVVEAPKVVKKRAPRKKAVPKDVFNGEGLLTSVTGDTTVTQRKPRLREKKCDINNETSQPSYGSDIVDPIPTKPRRPRGPRKKKGDIAMPAVGSNMVSVTVVDQAAVASVGTTEPSNNVRNQGPTQKRCPAEDGDIAKQGIRTVLTALCDTATGICDGKSEGDVTITKEQVGPGGPGEVLDPPQIHSPKTADLDTLQKQETKLKTKLPRDSKKNGVGQSSEVASHNLR